MTTSPPPIRPIPTPPRLTLSTLRCLGHETPSPVKDTIEPSNRKEQEKVTPTSTHTPKLRHQTPRRTTMSNSIAEDQSSRISSAILLRHVQDGTDTKETGPQLEAERTMLSGQPETHSSIPTWPTQAIVFPTPVQPLLKRKEDGNETKKWISERQESDRSWPVTEFLFAHMHIIPKVHAGLTHSPFS